MSGGYIGGELIGNLGSGMLDGDSGSDRCIYEPSSAKFLCDAECLNLADFVVKVAWASGSDR
jgi:hypothetical protein